MIDLALDGPLATLTFSRPPVNAMSSEWVDLFGRRLDELATFDGCAVLHIRSDQKIFSAGGDLGEFRTRFGADDGADQMFDYLVRIQNLFARIELLPQVTVAEIGGAVMGGGLELTLACDFRVAAEDIRLGLPEARLGLIPGAGGTQRLTRLCGPAVATRIILGGEIIDGAQAAALGLVHWAVPRPELSEKIRWVIASVSQLSRRALVESKACIAAANDPAQDGFERERNATRRLFNDPETRDRITKFLNKQLQAAR